MKKLIMSIVVVFTCLVVLCACSKTKQNFNSEDNGFSLQLNINILEATIYLSDSNKAVIDSIDAMESMDIETSLVRFEEALELVRETKTRVNASISAPNFISKELEELEENYEETIILISRFSELSEEVNEFVNLMVDGTYKHTLLVKALNALSYLYEIRKFDQLLADGSQSNLKESWWKFGFNSDIQCPETIEEQELYLIWARQYFDEFDEDRFLEELKELRENDNLSSSEQNRKWTEFIENFIRKAEEHSS